MFDERVTSECYAQINTYAAIHTVVRSHPRFHSRTSSTRSCNQNTGPMIETKRLKLTDIVGSDSDSREDMYTGSSVRRAAPVPAGGEPARVPALAPAPSLAAAPGRVDESKSCGISASVGDVSESAAEESIDMRRWMVVGEGGGDGCGYEV